MRRKILTKLLSSLLTFLLVFTPNLFITASVAYAASPTVTVNTPNGGQTLKGGSSYDITWTANDADGADIVTISLDYTTDGSSFTPITTDGLNDGTQSWTVPSIDSSTVQVRVTATDNEGTPNSTSDLSDAVFTIDSTAPSQPSITSVATDNKINNSEKNAIHVVGTAEADSLVTVTLTDSATTVKTGTQQLAGGATAYDVTIDGTTATALVDGNIDVSVTSTDPATNVSTAQTSIVTQDTVLPTLSSSRVTAANTITLIYSEAVTTVTGDYTNVTVGGVARSITARSGSGTATILLTFDGAASATSATGTMDISTSVVDSSGNAFAGAAGQALTDAQSATISTVDTTKLDGSYNAGTVIDFVVTYSEAVTVTGTPTLALNSGGSASYASGSGSTALTFSYTVAGGDNSSDLGYSATNSLSLAGGTIRDASSNNADNTLPATATFTGAHAIVIDTTVPTVSSVNSTTTNGSYKAGSVIAITINFSENVTVTGTPQLTLETGATDRTADYASGSGTSTLTFNYTVQAGDTASDLDYVANNSLTLNGGTIQDAATNNATLTLASPGATNSLGNNRALIIDTTAPTVSNITSPLADGSYKAGQIVNVTVTFSETVTVTGTPQLTLETGTTDRTINYSSGSGSTTLTFVYTVQAGDTSSDLDYTGTTALTLNGGTIQDAATNDATLTLPSPGASGSLGNNKALVIDTTAPSLPVISSVATNNLINSSEKSAIVVVGTAESGSTVTVTLTDSASTVKSNTGTATGGNYSITIDGTTATAFVDGNIDVSVTATDAATNVSSAQTSTVTLDTVAPTLSSVALSSNNVLSALFGKVGANVTVGFTASEAINTPSVSFSSGAVAVNGTPTITNPSGNDWSAYYVANSADTEGAVTYSISFSDLAGNAGVAVTSGTGSVTFDRTNPTATGTPSTTTPTNSTSQTWSWTAGTDALAGVLQYVWSVVDSLSQAVANGTTSSLSTGTSLTQGSYTFSVQTQDTAGNLSTASTGSLVVDTTNPSISADNSSAVVWQTTNPTITLSVSDSGGSSLVASKVRYAWDSTADATTGTVFTNGTTFNVPSEGTHVLNLYAEDNAGNSATFAGTYKIDTVAPTGSITAPSNNAYSNINPVFTASASDVTSGVGSVKFQYKTNAAGSYTDLNTDTNSTYDAVWGGTTLVTNTVYNLRVVITDAAGNTTNSSVISFTYDTTLPTITASTVLPLSGTSTNQTPVFSFDTSETSTCQYNLDSAGYLTMSTTGATSHSHTPGTLSTGSHTVQFRCTDLATNVSLVTSSTFTVMSGTGSSLDGSSSSPSFDSGVAGEAALPGGVTTINLSSSTNIDLTDGLDGTFNATPTIGGSAVNLNNPVSVGGQNVTLTQSVTLQSGTDGTAITMTNTGFSSASLIIPDGTTVLAPAGWNGQMSAPNGAVESGATPSGFSIGGVAYEFGSTNTVLLFSTPVSVILPSVTGQVVYRAAGDSSWTEITNTCGGTFASPTAPVFPGECKISNGTDTKVYTYHLTSFAQLNGASCKTDCATPIAPFTGGGSNDSWQSLAYSGTTMSSNRSQEVVVLGSSTGDSYKENSDEMGEVKAVETTQESQMPSSMEAVAEKAKENRALIAAAVAAILVSGAGAYYYTRKRD
jgi:large repetitive protein